MRVNIDDLDFDDDLQYFYNGEPLTGEAVETAPTGEVIVLTTFRNGIEHGPQRGWYRDVQAIRDYCSEPTSCWHRLGMAPERPACRRKRVQ